jgi:drug/metabolite transporter (DMT)-like permease
VLYLATVLIWGSTWIAIKYQLGPVAPEVSIAHRVAIAGVLTLLLGRLLRYPLRLGRRDAGFVFLQGLCLFSGNYLMIYAATAVLTTGLVAVVFSTMVILNAVGGALFLAMPLRGSVIVGGLLGLLGMFCLFLPELAALAAGGDTLSAVGVCFIGTVFASLGNMVAARNLRSGVPVLASNGWGMCFGAVTLYGGALLFGSPITVDWSPTYLGSLLYLSLFGTVLAFWAYVSLLGRIGPDRAAYTTLLFPVVALLISTLLESYAWTTWAVAGLALVLSGNWLAMRGARP